MALLQSTTVMSCNTDLVTFAPSVVIQQSQVGEPEIERATSEGGTERGEKRLQESLMARHGRSDLC